MKRYYLFLVLASIVCTGFAEIEKDDYSSRLPYALAQVKAQQELAKINRESSIVKREDSSISLKSGKTAYGYCFHDESWGV